MTSGGKIEFDAIRILRYQFALFSLRRKTFHNEYAALCCVLPDRPDCRIGWRVVPFTRLLHTVEFDDHDPVLWRVSFQGLNLAGTNDVSGG